MAEITDRRSLEAWLRPRPRADAVLVAARAALRVLPLVARGLRESSRERRGTILLPALRANAVAYVAGTWPRLEPQLRLVAAEAAARCAEAADTAGRSLATARTSVHAARAAALAVDRTTAHARAHAAGNAVDAAANGAAYVGNATAAAALWSEVGEDAWMLTGDAPPLAFRTEPLWHASEPIEIYDHWVELKEHLLAADEGWDVWTDWYEARRGGLPTIEAAEVGRAMIPDEVWQQGPAALNAEIARLIAEHDAHKGGTAEDSAHDAGTGFERLVAQTIESIRSLPDPQIELPDEIQKPAGEPPAPDVPPPGASALRFTMQDGRLRLAELPLTASPTGAEDGWSMLRECLSEMLGRQSIGNSPVRQSFVTALRALGESFADLNPLRLGLVGIALQEFAGRADEILLPEDAAQLHAIVLQQQLLLAQYPEWRAYAAALAPPLADAETEQAAANEAADIAGDMIERHPEAFDPAAAQAIADASDVATPEPTADNPNPVAPPEARRGWIRVFAEALRGFAVDAVQEGRKLATKGIGATGVTVIASVGAKLTGLAEMLPAEFGWLKSLVTYVSALVGA